MNFMKKYINLYLDDPLIEIPYSKAEDADFINLDSKISSIYHDEGSEIEVENLMQSLATRVEISKKFYKRYTHDWKKYKGAEVASSFQSSLLTLALYISYKKLQKLNASFEMLSKRMNAILKALDVSNESWIDCQSKLYQDINEDFHQLIQKLSFNTINSLNTVSLSFKHDKPQEVPITILYFEGPIARAYLEIFRSLNIKPQKIIEIVSSTDISSKKQIGNWLPRKLRIKYARYSQEYKINFWPRDIQKRNAELQNEIFEELNKKLNISKNSLKSTTAKLDLSDYCDNVETVFISGLKDKKLEEKLNKTFEDNILYTGGGIVPQSLLSIRNTNFIHIHPGYLPDVRGADCALWSSMIFKRASASCFYMSAGIDTGDIIISRWMPELLFNITKPYNDITLYRAVYSFIDPWVRAVVLREVLTANGALKDINTTQQKANEGYTYYFMHEKMKKASLGYLFTNN